MAIEPIKGFYVYDEENDESGVAKYDYGSLDNAPDIVSNRYSVVTVSELDGASYYEGYYGAIKDTRALTLTASSSYNSVVYYATEDFNLYVSPADYERVYYLSVCIIENAEPINNGDISGKSGTAARYRKSENNMPSLSSPLHVKKGSALIFTATPGNNTWQYFFDTSYELTDLVHLGDEQIEQVKNELVNIRKSKVRYINGSGSDASTERLEIFLPTVAGYVGYTFLHTVRTDTSHQQGNANVWRVGYAAAYDNNLIQKYAITASGEWELALHLPDRDDFSGGNAHGDEIFTGIDVLIDGLPVDHTLLTDLTEFDTLTIVEQSNIFDPADHETVIAEHGSEHFFFSDGLVISQSVKWLISTQTTACYMSMFPIAKTVSDFVYTNANYEVTEISGSVAMPKTDKAVLYSGDLGVKAVFKMSKQPFPDMSFLCTDNGGGDYNKCYYVIPQGQTVSASDRWGSVTEYNIIVSE